MQTSCVLCILLCSVCWYMYRLGQDIVDIVVEDGKHTLRVHESLIRASSPFCDKALNNLRASERTIQLPHEPSIAVESYVYWLYSGTLPVLPDGCSCSDYSALFASYVLGEKLLDQNFQNTTIDAIIGRSNAVIDGSRWYPRRDHIIYAYNNTSPSSPIRDLLVDMYLFNAERHWLEGYSDLPPAFVLELASRLVDERIRPNRFLDPTKYYRESRWNIIYLIQRLFEVWGVIH